MNEHLNPNLLPIVPPIDPMRLRYLNERGIFGTHRTDTDLYRIHQGVDLLGPIGGHVYAAAGGKVITPPSWNESVLIIHDFGFKFLTYYTHLKTISVAAGQEIGAGRKIAEINEFSQEDHLHFEIRYPFDATILSRDNSLALDPTMLLYRWEEKLKWADGRSTGPVQIQGVGQVWDHELQFFEINLPVPSQFSVFVPLHQQRQEDVLKVETAQQAFFHGKRVTIKWRDSAFFGKKVVVNLQVIG